LAPQGRFIVFEGGEGVGKSTQLERLAAALARAQIAVRRTREPGGTEGAEAIRRLLLDGASRRWDPLVELLLVAAARQDHLLRVIRPALAEGAWVLCDRFVDSTRVYQGIAGGLGQEIVDRLHRELMHVIEPDLVILLDLPVAVGLERRRAQGGVSRFERKGPAFHEAVRAGFLALAAAEPARIATIDATPDVDTVAAAVAARVSAHFGIALP
jgi:dTMP kinase